MLAGGSDQPIGFHQSAAIFWLGSQRKADRDEERAQQEANHHHAPVGFFVGLVEGRGHRLFPESRNPNRNRPQLQRGFVLNLTD
jgi:hypothetical protein